jgi:hypothetical protein
MNWNLELVSSRGLLPSCDLLICELEFRESEDYGFRISKSGLWESGISTCPFWTLESAHDSLNLKSKRSESRLIRISVRNVKSTDVVICTILRSNRSGFKRTKYY